MSARLSILILIAIGRTATAAPHLVCTLDGKPLRAGGRTPLDHEVACAIEGTDAHADAAQITMAMARPLAIELSVDPHDPHPAARDGDRWVAAPFTPDRCAPTTFRGELHHGADVVWAGELAVRPDCKAIRFVHPPALACAKHTIIDSDTPARFHVQIDCEVVVTDQPKGPELDAWFRRTPPGDPADTTGWDKLDTEGDDATHLRASLTEPTEEAPCKPIRVDAAITRDGGIVWVGRTTYTPDCPKPRR